MNIIAVDIGNTNIAVGFFLEGKEEFVRSFPSGAETQLRESLASAWEQIPVLETSAEGKRDGVVVVSSVKPSSTEFVRGVVADDLGEKLHVVGEDIPLPISVWVDEPEQVGTDRVVAAAAAYAVVEGAVAVADFGTAVTIDLVDDSGVFQGGSHLPRFRDQRPGPEGQYRPASQGRGSSARGALRQEYRRRHQLRPVLLDHRGP